MFRSRIVYIIMGSNKITVYRGKSNLVASRAKPLSMRSYGILGAARGQHLYKIFGVSVKTMDIVQHSLKL